MNPVYEKLVDSLRPRGGDVPFIKGPELYALLSELFTEEEAELASGMPVGPFTALELAAKFPQKEPKQVVGVLEGMADHGLILAFAYAGGRQYNLPTLLPGFMEYAFMRGEVTERTRRIAVLLEKYLEVTRKAPVKKGETWSYPYFRVITVEKEIDAGFQVQPYDKLTKYIDMADCIALCTCFCHHFEELKGNHCCDKPMEVCFNFGRVGRNNIDRGFAREITREEAHRIMRESEEAGLVHVASNIGKYIDAICNCSGCHCLGLRKMNTPGAHKLITSSGFVAVINAEECIACGDCLPRCQVDAITLTDDTAVLSKERCIGCGLCLSTCPSGAIKLELRAQPPVPPVSRKELGEALLNPCS